jgi:hypothetical protein
MKSLKILKAEYEKMYTKQLLARYRSIRFNYCNWDMYEPEEISQTEMELDIIKTILDTREHVPNKQEAKKIRQENAKKKR